MGELVSTWTGFPFCGSKPRIEEAMRTGEPSPSACRSGAHGSLTRTALPRSPVPGTHRNALFPLLTDETSLLGRGAFGASTAPNWPGA
jgi:hypothetical protein